MKALIAIGQIIFFEIKSLRLEFFEEVLYNKNKINKIPIIYYFNIKNSYMEEKKKIKLNWFQSFS